MEALKQMQEKVLDAKKIYEEIRKKVRIPQNKPYQRLGIESLSEPFVQGVFTLAVIGPMSAGKSSFINALLEDEDLLPTGHFQTTCTLTELIYSPQKNLKVEYGDGHIDNYEGDNILKTIKEVVHYLSIKFFISFATSILVFILLMIMKIDFAIIWAFLAFIMNFIPTFGSIISVGITSLFALIQYFPNPIPMFVVLIGMTAINFTLGNIIEPKIEGDNLDLSPFIILVSLLFWGWMWGFVGMILSVPIMVILKIICENFKILHPIAILLGNKTSKTLKELSNFEDEEEEKNSKNAETNKS